MGSTRRFDLTRRLFFAASPKRTLQGMRLGRRRLLDPLAEKNRLLRRRRPHIRANRRALESATLNILFNLCFPASRLDDGR
jgi:hypothetical protein